MSREIWKYIVGYEGIYQISNLGNIKSMPRLKRLPNNQMFICKEKFMRINVDRKRGYCQIELSNNGVKQTHKTHRLVAMAFIPNPKNKPQINHINGIKTDNRVENLEWCDNSENQIHAYKEGLNTSLKGEDHPNSKLTNKERAFIKKNFTDKKMTAEQLASRFKINKLTVYRVSK